MSLSVLVVSDCQTVCVCVCVPPNPQGAMGGRGCCSYRPWLLSPYLPSPPRLISLKAPHNHMAADGKACSSAASVTWSLLQSLPRIANFSR